MRLSTADGSRRCEKPGCSKTFVPNKHTPKSGPNMQRYCSNICRVHAYQFRHGLRRRVPYGMCKYGRHERTPENTKILGNGRKRCMDCVRESQQRRRKGKQRPESEKIRARAYYQEHREEIRRKAKVKRALGEWKSR